MKKLLSVILLITAIMLTSCKEESAVHIQKNSAKKVNNLSYSFANVQGEKDNTTKSSTLSDITTSLGKVLSTELLEVEGEYFTATLIEESDPISTKVPATQVVKGSGVYTFYSYKNSAIKQQSVNSQSVTQTDRTFEVPVDAATKYGIIFLSTVEGVPESTRLKLDSDKKEITYQTVFNENVCYSIFDKGNMPPKDEIDVTLTPVFSQIGISVPKEFYDGRTIKTKVDEFSLVSGIQETATVQVMYNSQEVSNIVVDYAKDVTTDYQPKLKCVSNATNDTTILEGRYYNIISNGNDAQVYIKITLEGRTTQVLERTIQFKDKDSNPIPFGRGKRYIIKVNNVVGFTIEDYFQWDAQDHYNINNPNEGFGPGLSGYNRTTGIPTYTCANASTLEQAGMYLAAGVYWDTDGPEYTLPNGITLKAGLWVRKSSKIDGFKENKANKKYLIKLNDGTFYRGKPDVITDYFFLPACGHYKENYFASPLYYSYLSCYWLSTNTPNISNPSIGPTFYAHCFSFSNYFAGVNCYCYDDGKIHTDGGMRFRGMPPMVGFDPTYTK